MIVRLVIKNYNMILAEKQQKYHQVKFISMDILQAKKYHLLIKLEQLKKAKLTNSPLEKGFEKQMKAIED